jgi:hypothetical protein
VAFAAALFIIFSPQLATYKILNGVFAPSSHVTEKFVWTAPYALKVLFSTNHGLFSWTPILFFAVAGLVPLFRRDRLLAVCFAAAFLAGVYLVGSYSTWSGGGAFGARRFVNCTVIFVLGLAMLIDWLRARIELRWLAIAGAAFVAWNFLLIVQYVTNMIPREGAIDFSQMIYNQFFDVPPRLGSIAWRFFFDRSSFFKIK